MFDKLDDSIDSGNFSVSGYLPLIQKDSITLMPGLADNDKEGLSFALNFSLENSAHSNSCIWLTFSPSVVYFFFLYRSLFSSLWTVFDSISFNMNEAFSLNPSANLFVFIDFNIHHKDWLTYSCGTDRPVNSIINNFTQTVNFPTRILDYDSYSPALFYLFISSDASTFSTICFYNLFFFYKKF